MKGYVKSALIAFVVGVLAMGIAGSASAQQKSLKQRLVGTWLLVSNERTEKDGSHVQGFGPNPKGILIFGRDGRMAVMIMRSDRPKYAANDRMMGTPEEYKATAQGAIAYFGTYSVNEADHSYTVHVESSAYPNWNGTDQRRIVDSVTANELKTTDPTPSTGSVSHSVYKRAK